MKGKEGKRGKPGKPGHGQTGGEGGVGGAGGEGGTTGGEGGAGGTGGQTGPQGDRGPRGKTSLLPIVGYLILVVAIAFVLYRIEGVSDENRNAICAMKTNANAQIRASEQFLVEHPEGIPGISRKDIEAGLERQRMFAKAFEDVECE